MIWKFSMIDASGIATPFPEPPGWDAQSFTLDRDRDMHGVAFLYSLNDMRYTGAPARALLAAYNAAGVQAVMSLRIEAECGGTLKLFEGRYDFSRFVDKSGNTCEVICPVEEDSDTMTFRNRIDQKVNLETLTGFDGAALPAYSALGKQIILPGKGIYVEDSAKNEGDNSGPWVGIYEPGAGGGGPGTIGTQHVAFFIPGFNKSIGSEIGGFVFPDDNTESFDTFANAYGDATGWIDLPYDTGAAGFPRLEKMFPDMPAIVNYDEELGNAFGPITLTMEGRFFGQIVNNQVGPDNVAKLLQFQLFLGILKAGQDPLNASSWDWKSTDKPAWGPFSYNATGYGPYTTIDKDFNYTVTLNPGDRIYYFFRIGYAKYSDYQDQDAFQITYFNGSYFRLHGLSKLPATPSKMFLANEAWSRTVEAITNARVRAFSEYFGRTDSQPYNHLSDGKGSREGITKGQFIRRLEEVRPDAPTTLTLSIRDLWEGFNPIHNLGVGLEADPVRPGYSRLRVEPWRYFYQSQVIFTAYDPDIITRSAKADEHYSTFRFGYDKWEAEQFNGIDEFLTTREYRTTLKEVNNRMEQISSFIASGYAIEVTRRKGNKTSEDWRYDNDTFIICLRRGGPAQYNVRFTAPYILFLSLSTPKPWMVVGNQFTVSGAFPVGNNTTYTITGVTVVAGNVRLSVSPAPASSFPQMITVAAAADTELHVEQGGIINPGDIIDPDTIYNFRITPLRNAMRWLPEVLGSYRTAGNGSPILFTSGTGNVHAKGEHNTAFYKQEANGAVVQEDQTLTPANMQLPGSGLPVFYAEEITYRYPMTVPEFLAIRANPYGTINTVVDGIIKPGYLRSLKYMPEEQLAEFTIIPKRT